MIELKYPFRRATRADADAIVELVNIAGEGLSLYFWGKMAEPGVSAWDIGKQRARRETDGFSYTNTIVGQERDAVVSALIGYPLPDTPAPVDYDELPQILVPLQQLEDLVPGTWYVNPLATYADHRGKGHGSALLAIAERLAAATNCRGTSIIVSDANSGARRLYERSGYREVAVRPMIKESWQNPGENWVLLQKSL